MAHCPECGIEYRDDATECMDCGVPLVPGPPEQESMPAGDAQLVPIRVFRGPTATMEADLARNVLATQGIPSVLPGETSGEILPGVDIVQLLVSEQDAEEAGGILESYFDRETPVETPDLPELPGDREKPD